MSKLLPVLAVSVLLGLFGVGQSADELVSQARALHPTRYIPENLQAEIDLCEKALALAPDRADIMAVLAQLHYEFAIASEDVEIQRREFRRGADVGFAALGLGDLDGAEGTKLERFREIIQAADNVAALYWTAKAWGMLVDSGGLGAQLNAIFRGMPGKIRALYLRAIEVDETYFGGGPHEDYGALLVNFTKYHLYGATMEEAKVHLDRAIEIATGAGYLIPFVTYAEQYAVRVKDRALFEDLLNHVMEAPIGDWPFWNRHAKKQAEDLLGREAELFR